MRVLLILISLLSFGLVADNKPNDFILYCKSEVTSQEAIYKYSKSNELFRSWVKRNNSSESSYSYFEPEYDDYILLIYTTKLVFAGGWLIRWMLTGCKIPLNSKIIFFQYQMPSRLTNGGIVWVT